VGKWNITLFINLKLIHVNGQGYYIVFLGHDILTMNLSTQYQREFNAQGQPFHTLALERMREGKNFPIHLIKYATEIG